MPTQKTGTQPTRLSVKSPIFIGCLLIGLAIVFFLLNFSVLPLVGAILAIPALIVGIYLVVKGSRASRTREQRP